MPTTTIATMTTEELEALGRRAVACKSWRWMAGMLVLETDDDFGERLVAWSGGLTTRGIIGGYGWEPSESDMPDLSDPATLGCLLALVREAWGDEGTYSCRLGQWVVIIHNANSAFFQDVSEAAALVAALEDAPIETAPCSS